MSLPQGDLQLLEGDVDADCAPTAGPPPYLPYAITPETVYGIGTDEEFATRSTRWRFQPGAPGGRRP